MCPLWITCALLPFHFLLAVRRAQQEIYQQASALPCEPLLFREILTHLGNVYLEMKLDLFHLDSHKLGLHLKIPNFLAG